MIGRKTGGRRKGTPNKQNQPIKEQLRNCSLEYFQPSVKADQKLADQLGVKRGTLVSKFDIDLALMEPASRAAIQEKLLRYHTPQMQNVAAQVAVSPDADTLEQRLAQLAAQNDQ